MIKIAITGVESTGKSTLARELTNHFKGIYVEEFARSFLADNDTAYSYDDVLTIAKIQHKLIQKAASGKDAFLFADTELLVTYVWCSYKFGKVHSWISENLLQQKFDLYLLPAVDLPWQSDPLRENPNDREILFNTYLAELERLHFPYAVISGRDDERLQNAIRAIETR